MNPIERDVMVPFPSQPTNVGHRRRSRTLGAVVVVGGLLLAACGSPPSSGGGGGGRDAAGQTSKLPKCPLDALKKAKGPVKVNLWYSGLVSPPVDVLTGMVKSFNQSQDKVVVTADYQGNSYAEGLRKYEGASATPAQLPNLMYLEDTMLGELVDKGQILPAQSCMEADGYDPEQLTAAARSAYSVDGVLYPGYLNVSTPVIYYNKVHFKKAGLDPNKPPTTLAEMEEAARKIKAAGVAPKPISFLANEWFFSTWMAGLGQDGVDNNNGRTKPPTKATFNTPEVQDLMAELAKANKAGLLNPFPVTDGKIDHYLALLTEQSSMLIETSTASGTIAGALGGEITGASSGLDLDTSLLDTAKLVPSSGKYPGVNAPGKIYASGGAFYILNTSSPAEQAASWMFLKYMLQPENALKWHLVGGYLPVVKSILDAPAIAKFQKTELTGQLLKPAVEQLAAADPDQAGPLIGPYTGYSASIRKALEGVLFSGQDPKAALDQAERDVNALFKDYNDQ